MVLIDIKHITMPENHVVITMSYEQFRKFMKGVWRETRIYRTPDGSLYTFLEGRELIYTSEPKNKPNEVKR